MPVQLPSRRTNAPPPSPSHHTAYAPRPLEPISPPPPFKPTAVPVTLGRWHVVGGLLTVVAGIVAGQALLSDSSSSQQQQRLSASLNDSSKQSAAAAAGASSSSRSTAGVWEGLSSSYDSSIERDEWMTGVLRRRRKLIGQAKGDVIELGVGTGRNLAYYDFRSVRSLTVVDRSAGMLRETSGKWSGIIKAMQHQHSSGQQQQQQENQTATQPRLSVVQFDMDRLAESHCSTATATATDSATDTESAQSQQPQSQSVDSLAAATLAFPSGSFDTVVDTFGLCSYTDELAAMREMGRLVKPGTGRILLLQHGRRCTQHSSPLTGWPIGWMDKPVNSFLARHRSRHLEVWGCVWDKDHEAALQHMVDTHGWRVLDRQHFHFGTGLMVVAQVGEGAP